MMRGINTTVRRLRRKVLKKLQHLASKQMQILCAMIWKQSHMHW